MKSFKDSGLLAVLDTRSTIANRDRALGDVDLDRAPRGVELDGVVDQIMRSTVRPLRRAALSTTVTTWFRKTTG
ncbi:MAG: hypothetical protein RL550_1765 [Actinomycetota bacterium]